MQKKDYRLSLFLGLIILITISVVATPIIFIQYQSSSKLFEEKLLSDFKEDLNLTQLFLNSELNLLKRSLNSITENVDLLKSLESNDSNKTREVLDNLYNDLTNSDFLFLTFEHNKELIDVSINLMEDDSTIKNYLKKSSNKSLSFGVDTKSNVVAFTKKSIISPRNGKVLATVHTGVLLNNNLELTTRISEKIKNHNLFLFLDDKFIAGTRTLEEKELRMLQSRKHEELFSLNQKIFYTGRLDFSEEINLNISFETSSIFIEELRHSFFKYSLYTILMTIALAAFSMFITHRLLTPSLNRLLDFLKSSIENDELPTFEKSSIREFNMITENFSTVFHNFLQKKNQLADFINSSQLPTLIWDKSGNIIQINQSAKSFLQLKGAGDNIISDSLLADSYSFKQLLKKLEHTHEVSNEEIIFKYNNIWKHSLWTINIDKSEEVYFAQCFDNSEKVRAQTQIELERAKSVHNQKLAAIGEVASSIAHEVNNPMGIISLSLSILEDEFSYLTIESPKKTRKIKNCFQNIEDSVERTSTIVSNLLDFSRESSKDKQNNKSLSAIFNKTLIFIEGKLKKQKVKLEIDEIDSNLIVFVKETQFSQVIVNLLNNSVDAMESSPIKRIKVTSKCDKDSCYIEIFDSGPGISKDIADQIFTPFFTTKEKGKGTGLGLSISKSIMKEMHGDLTLMKSEEGAHFVIKLPLKVN